MTAATAPRPSTNSARTVVTVGGVEPLDVILLQQIASPELDWPALAQALSSSSQARLVQMRAVGRRQEFILGRTLATRLLHTVSGNDAWDLVPRAGGKPVAIDNNGREHAALSLSHSRGQVLGAIAPTGQLGCDIEVPRSRSATSWRRLANFTLPHPVFAPHERHWILDAPDLMQQPRLYALWTIKEAMGKASGSGLRRGLAGLLVDVATIPPDFGGNEDYGSGVVASGVTQDASLGMYWHWQLRREDQALISVAADEPFTTRWLTAG